jgi:hypothetical protein
MDDEAIERAVRDACLGEAPELAGLPPRVAIYRRLVRNTLGDVVGKLLERTRREMGVSFDEAFARWLDERGPRTHFLRDVPHELVAWATPFWRDLGVPAWMIDLARHEMTSFGVSSAPHLPELRAEEVSLDRGLLLTNLARIERYAFAVHEDASPPFERPVALLYYRDSEHLLRVLELSPLAAAILECARLPLRDAIAQGCEATAVPMNDDTLASIARLLADLGERGVLLGALP